MWTRNLRIFIVLAGLLTIMLNYGMGSLDLGHGGWFTLLGVCYGVVMFAIGWVLGHRDTDAQRFLGFGYHLYSYAIVNGVPLLWIWLGNVQDTAGWPNLAAQYSLMFWWGIFGLGSHMVIVIHTRRNMIRGLEREEIFE
jgi:hypothetical protein